MGNSRTPPFTALTSHPLDFRLLGKLKEHLSGKRFASVQEVENETRNWFANLDANFYAEGILKLVSCWDTCLNLLEIMWRKI
jgi:hypothetical protein